MIAFFLDEKDKRSSIFFLFFLFFHLFQSGMTLGERSLFCLGNHNYLLFPKLFFSSFLFLFFLSKQPPFLVCLLSRFSILLAIIFKRKKFIFLFGGIKGSLFSQGRNLKNFLCHLAFVVYIIFRGYIPNG